MFTLRPISAILVSVGLLQACSTAPEKMGMLMQPVLRVSHSADQAAATYYQLGKYHQERGNLDLALAAYTYSISRDKQHLEARNAAASIYAQQGKLNEARSMLLEVIAELPSAALYYNNLGYVYYLQGDYSAAALTLQLALTLDAGNERARNNLQLARAALAKLSAPVSAPAIASAPLDSLAQSAQSKEPLQPAARDTLALRQTPLELVQIIPNVYELKLKASATLLSTESQARPEIAATKPPAMETAKVPRLEIANGNGITGMATQTKRLLIRSGIAVNRVTNARSYQQQQTTIQYRPDFQAQAEALKKTLRINAVLVVTKSLSLRSDLRLLLGKDAVAQLAAADGLADAPLLASNGITN